MKLFLVLCLVSIAVAAPTLQKINYPTEDVQLLRFESENPGEGNFRFAYEQTDGTKQEQQGELRNEGTEDETIVIRGSFTWVGPDGVTYKVNFTADDDGYKPVLEQGPGGAIPKEVIDAFLG